MQNSQRLSDQDVTISYTNYRGETSERKIKPLKIWFGKTEWHTEPQWILDAFDYDKQAERSFALTDIKLIMTSP